ncbi:MAG TPA: class I SAM-dependent methyltransferase, partial [Thermomicrobiales bacterium]|nr:class I SAM-dependent methyltransferase [Thermomicrobiales bacterium]
MPEGWEWDETLYRGSAPFYIQGRPPYAPGLADALIKRLAPHGSARLLDVGCGPGVLTLDLAPLVDEAIGLDPDPEMLAEAARRASTLGVGNARWLQARGEDLPAGLGRFDLVTFGQSFHWMDRARVAAAVRDMLTPDGMLVLVADVKSPKAAPGPLPAPPPPYEAIRSLVRRWLGPVQRAGQGRLPHGSPGDEETVLAAVGFAGPERLELPAGPPRIRTEDDVVAWVWSLSGSAPHLFGEQRGAFEAELRGALRVASPTGVFAEAPPATDVRMWRRAPSTSHDPSADNARVGHASANDPVVSAP